jgi:hypothetical protein
MGSLSTQWFAAAVAQKIGAVEVAPDFFKGRAANARPEDLETFLQALRISRPSPVRKFPIIASPNR